MAQNCLKYDETYSIEDLNFDQIPRNYFGMGRSTYLTSRLRENNLSLLENTLFEDIFLNVFTISNFKNVIFYELNAYHYFIGRPEQSVSKDNLIKSLPNWNKVLKQISDYYYENHSKFSPRKKIWLENPFITSQFCLYPSII